VDDFIRVADEIEDRFPGLVVEGEETLEGGGGGEVEVSLGDTALRTAASDAGIARILEEIGRTVGGKAS
jgi:hypothetical protein